MNGRRLVIGSRGSDLALWQSRAVLRALQARAHDHWHDEITVIATRGDSDSTPWPAGRIEKGFFTRELEVALADGRIDLVVHSLKDLPTATPPGLVTRTVLPRANPTDWLLVRPGFHDGHTGGALPLRPGTRVGASSLRRRSLLEHFAPDARAVPLRGNVPTRLRRLHDGNVDAIVVAAAGLERLRPDLSAFAVIELSPTWWVPAPAQGALAVQYRATDAAIGRQIDALEDPSCRAATTWERDFLRVTEGGCATPFGCLVAGDTAWLGSLTANGWVNRETSLPAARSATERAAFARMTLDQTHADLRPIERTVRAR